MTTTVQWDHATVFAELTTSLSTVDAELFAGELCLVAGATGSGKSTLLRTVNGSVPHDGTAGITGRVRVLGRDTASHPPRRLSDVVGVVPARPTDSFIATTVEEEVGFSVDRVRPGPQARSRRIEERLALFGLAELRTRPLAALSAGQQQRVALAAALAAEPDVLVLDEPTSGLDPAGAAALGQALQAVARTSGTTVLMSEHRLERLVAYVDSMIYLHGNGTAQYSDPRTVLADAPLAPPIIELSRLLRWHPPAVTIAEAIAAAQTNPLPEPEPGSALPEPPEPVLPRNSLVARVEGLSVRHGPLHAIRDLDLTIRAGEIVALCGGNGAGKSTLLACLAGLHRPQRGTAEVAGYDPTRLRGTNRARAVGLVPADPAELLLTDRIDRECAAADDEARAPGGRTSFMLEALVPGLSPLRDPRTLSAGEQQALALAVVLARGPALILLDEPTRGLDYAAKSRLITMLRRLASAGHAVLVATHDVELTAVLASRVVTLNEGRLTGDGSIAAALRQRIVRTQVGAVMAPAPLYTVDDVRRELAG